MGIDSHMAQQLARVEVESDEESIQLGADVKGAGLVVYLSTCPRAGEDSGTIGLINVRGCIAVQKGRDVGLPLHLALGVVVGYEEAVPSREIGDAVPESGRGADTGRKIHFAIAGELLDVRQANFFVA